MPCGYGSLPGASRPRPPGCEIEAAHGFIRRDGEVMGVNCLHWTMETMECARASAPPSALLQEHLRQCPPCAQRWDDERRLSSQFRALRGAAARRQSETRREQLMCEFDLAHQSVVPASLKWLLSAAAVLLLTIAIGFGWRNSRRPLAIEASIEAVEELADDN